jgi:hypothetical protein
MQKDGNSPAITMARKEIADHYRGLRRRIGTRAARAHWKIDNRAHKIWMRALDKALYEDPSPILAQGGLGALIGRPTD